jgi:hypothetical protein
MMGCHQHTAWWRSFVTDQNLGTRWLQIARQNQRLASTFDLQHQAVCIITSIQSLQRRMQNLNLFTTGFRLLISFAASVRYRRTCEIALSSFAPGEASPQLGKTRTQKAWRCWSVVATRAHTCEERTVDHEIGFSGCWPAKYRTRYLPQKCSLVLAQL